jgi:hypothetical protein
MADIVINTETFFEVENTVARLFVAAGLARYRSVVKAEQPTATPPPQEPTFSLGTVGPSAIPCIILRRPDGSQSTFAGRPEEARTAFQVLAWSAAKQARILQGPIPPDSVIAGYLAKFPQDSAVLAERKRQQLADAQAAQDAQHAPGKPKW